jgi:hypothetical protein
MYMAAATRHVVVHAPWWALNQPPASNTWQAIQSAAEVGSKNRMHA